MKWLMRPKRGSPYTNFSLMVILCLVPLIVIPSVVTSVFILDVILMSFHYAYLASAWNTFSGFTGLISFGHAVFYGIGAYTTVLLYLHTGLSPWFGLLIGGLISASMASLLGFALFKLRGSYFALSTWAIREIFRFTFLSAEFTNGAMGLWPSVVHPDSWWHFQFHTSRAPYYRIMLVLLIVCLLICWKIRYSRLGLNLLAVKNDETAAQSCGISPFKHKQMAMVISAALTSIGGGFYAQYILYVDPDTVMSAVISLDMILPALIGGIGTVQGPLVGALFQIPITWIIRRIIGYSPLNLVIRGALLIIIVVFMPSGIIGSIEEKFKNIFIRR